MTWQRVCERSELAKQAAERRRSTPRGSGGTGAEHGGLPVGPCAPAEGHRVRATEERGGHAAAGVRVMVCWARRRGVSPLRGLSTSGASLSSRLGPRLCGLLRVLRGLGVWRRAPPVRGVGVCSWPSRGVSGRRRAPPLCRGGSGGRPARAGQRAARAGRGVGGTGARARRVRLDLLPRRVERVPEGVPRQVVDPRGRGGREELARQRQGQVLLSAVVREEATSCVPWP